MRPAGTFFLVVGASGVGKDALLSGAKAALRGDDRFIFVRRTITRPARTSTHLTHAPGSSIIPSVNASTRRPSISTVPDGRIGVTVFPCRPFRASSPAAAGVLATVADLVSDSRVNRREYRR